MKLCSNEENQSGAQRDPSAGKQNREKGPTLVNGFSGEWVYARLTAKKYHSPIFKRTTFMENHGQGLKFMEFFTSAFRLSCHDCLEMG